MELDRDLLHAYVGDVLVDIEEFLVETIRYERAKSGELGYIQEEIVRKKRYELADSVTDLLAYMLNVKG